MVNLEQSPRKCAVCVETEPSFIHTVTKDGVFRRLCTDCLLKEHRELFCPVCLDVFVAIPPPDARVICLNCPSFTHLSCAPPPPSSAAAPSFTCPPCSTPNFSFFPKSHDVPSSDQNGENDADGSGTLLDVKSTKALVAAARISSVCMNKAAARLRKEAVEKILEAKTAKMKAKEALGNLQDLVVLQKALQNNKNSNKRKNRDR